MKKDFARIGALGAITDIYQKAVDEYVDVLKHTSQKEFITMVDKDTDDEDCRSIQTITRHIIRSGYGYAGYILKALNIPFEIPNANEMKLETTEEAIREIYNMLYFNITNLYDLNRELIENNLGKIKFMTRWNEEYNFEQILEHAVMHILRHKRQINKFLVKQMS
ncbi:MAG: DinB family protein [Ignavibacteriales bacterium]|nr:DinB family protein [Ignavibacteriales bacterium]